MVFTWPSTALAAALCFCQNVSQKSVFASESAAKRFCILIMYCCLTRSHTV